MADLNMTDVVSATPTLAAGTYAAGDAFGTGAIALANATKNAQTAVIVSVTLRDKTTQAADVDVLFFSQNPSASTLTDNAAVDIDDADLASYYLGHVMVRGTDYSTFADNCAACLPKLNLAVKTTGTGTAANTLYAVIVARESVTIASASDYTLTVGLLQD